MYLKDIQEDDFEIALKVVIVGNGAVGKSSMIQKYCRGIFTSEYKKTIGVDFLEKRICVSGEDMRLMLWDTAGQEEFDCITRAYYRGAQACVLAFSCVDRESFKSVVKWKKKVEEECGNIPMVLVMTKMDLLYRAEIDSFEVEKLSRNLGIHLVKTSVKENINVNKVFLHLANRHLDEINQWTTDPPLIQIGGAGFGGFSQAGFLASYGSNWDMEPTEKRKKKRIKKKVNFCTSNYINFCETNAFFLTPLKKKPVIHKDKVDFKTICKVL